MGNSFFGANKHKTLKYLVVSLVGVVMVVGTIVASRGFSNPLNATPADTYEFTLNPTQFGASALPTEFRNEYTKTFADEDYVQQTFEGTDKPVINYFIAKKDESNNLVLAPSGKVFNYSKTATYKGRVTNISSLVVEYSGGTLYAAPGEYGESNIYGKKVPITSGAAISFESRPNFVMISNSVANTTITKITFNYSCEEAGYITGRLGSAYTTMDSTGTSYTLYRDGSNVTFANYSGTIAVASNGTFSMSLDNDSKTYSGKVSSDYKSLYVTGMTGTGPVITNLNKAFVMEDFESYSQTGKGYSSDGKASDKTKASDLRAELYGDYGGGGNSTWVEDSDFSVAYSSDYVNLTTVVKHGGSKAATIKGWSGGWTRNWNRECFDSKQFYGFGYGNKLSFWTHGAYTNTGCTAASSKNVKIKVVVYYTTDKITDSNRKTKVDGTGDKDFTVNANSDWTEQVINLDPSRIVTGINFMVDGQGSGLSQNVFVPIDDIIIHSSSTVEADRIAAESSTRITKTYNGVVHVSSYTFTMKLGLGSNGYIYAYCGADMVPTSYTINGTSIVIVTTGSYLGRTFGTWTGTLSNNNSRITINKSNINGTIKSFVQDDSIVLNEDNVALNGESDPKTSYITKQKKSMAGSWGDYDSLDGQFGTDNNHFIQGNGSVLMNSNGASHDIRMIVKPAVAAQLGSITSISFWYYVPAGVAYNISIYGYKSATPSNESGQYAQLHTKEYDGTTCGWHYVNLGTTVKVNNVDTPFDKNVGIVVKCVANSYFDYMTFF